MQRVIFLTEHQLGNHPETSLPISASASGRLRVIQPARGLSDLNKGIEIRIHNPTAPFQEISRGVCRNTVFIVSKMYREASLEVLKALKTQTPAFFIGDFCDNYFTSGDHYEAQHQILHQIDAAFVNSYEMLGALRAAGYVKSARIVTEGVDSVRGIPRVLPRDGLIRLLAYGNRLVCSHLEKWFTGLSTFAVAVRPLHLEIVTRLDSEVLRWYRNVTKRFDQRFSISMTQWNEVAMEHAFLRADIALIPSDYSEFNRTKSANRLHDALFAGIPAICFPIEAYVPHYMGVEVGEDVYSLLSYCIKNRNQIREQIFAFQDLLARENDSKEIGRKWYQAIETTLQLQGQPVGEVRKSSILFSGIEDSEIARESLLVADKNQLIPRNSLQPLSSTFASFLEISANTYATKVNVLLNSDGILFDSASWRMISSQEIEDFGLTSLFQYPKSEAELEFSSASAKLSSALSKLGYLRQDMLSTVCGIAFQLSFSRAWLSIDGWYFWYLAEQFYRSTESIFGLSAQGLDTASKEVVAFLLLAQHLLIARQRKSTALIVKVGA